MLDRIDRRGFDAVQSQVNQWRCIDAAPRPRRRKPSHRRPERRQLAMAPAAACRFTGRSMKTAGSRAQSSSR